MNDKKRRVLLIGWDAADWKVARPLMERGEMPNLARLVAGGASGNLATIYPPLSPMLWTSIPPASGRRSTASTASASPCPTARASGRSRRSGGRPRRSGTSFTKTGLRPSVVGWWPSTRPSRSAGVMVSNHFHQAGDRCRGPAAAPRDRPPARLVRAARRAPGHADGAARRADPPVRARIRPGRSENGQAAPLLGKIIAETMTMHAAATEVLEHADWDFAAVYYDAIDHFCHAFMPYHPPRLPWIEEEDFAIYQHVIANAYRYHDAMLGRLLELAGPEATVIVMSDHGFHPDDHAARLHPGRGCGAGGRAPPFRDTLHQRAGDQGGRDDLWCQRAGRRPDDPPPLRPACRRRHGRQGPGDGLREARGRRDDPLVGRVKRGTPGRTHRGRSSTRWRRPRR